MTAGLSRLLLDGGLRAQFRCALASDPPVSDPIQERTRLIAQIEMATPTAPTVSILIPTYNQAQYIGQAIRSDDAQALSLDLAESVGVLGARRINRSLYIALDPGTVEPVVALIPDASPPGMIVPAGRIGVLDSNLEILSSTRTPCLSVLEVTGWGKGEIGFYGDPGASFLVNIVAGARQSGGLVLGHIKVVADASGFAAVTMPTQHGNIETVSLQQQCPG